MRHLGSATSVAVFSLLALVVPALGDPQDAPSTVVLEWDGKGWAALRIRITADAVQIPGPPPHLIEFIANITYAPTDWAVGCGISPGPVQDSSRAALSTGLFGLDAIVPPVTVGPFFELDGAEGWFHQWLINGPPGDYLYVCNNPSPETLHTRLTFNLAPGVHLVADTFGTTNGVFREKDFGGTVNVHAQVGNGPVPDGAVPPGAQAALIDNGLIHLDIQHTLLGGFDYFYRGAGSENVAPTVVPYPAVIGYRSPDGTSEWGDEYYTFRFTPPGGYDFHVGFYADADPSEYGWVQLTYADVLLP